MTEKIRSAKYLRQETEGQRELRIVQKGNDKLGWLGDMGSYHLSLKILFIYFKEREHAHEHAQTGRGVRIPRDCLSQGKESQADSTQRLKPYARLNLRT